ncbi:MAG: hypothetical protein ACHQ1D_01390 [Nitrososphaerales archaeon]
MAQEIKGVTWDLDGEQLEPYLAAQRLYKAGFKDADLLCTMWAVIEAESGGYLKAWHHNVERNEDGTIKIYDGYLMNVKSTDLGFIQKNIPHEPDILLPIQGDQSQLFVNDLFVAFPELARGDESAKIAYQMYKTRGFQPWYAYSNGSYKKSIGRGTAAVANFLALKNGLRPMPYVKRIDP